MARAGSWKDQERRRMMQFRPEWELGRLDSLGIAKRWAGPGKAGLQDVVWPSVGLTRWQAVAGRWLIWLRSAIFHARLGGTRAAFLAYLSPFSYLASFAPGPRPRYPGLGLIEGRVSFSVQGWIPSSRQVISHLELLNGPL